MIMVMPMQMMDSAKQSAKWKLKGKLLMGGLRQNRLL
jgi:hypothetical protein